MTTFFDETKRVVPTPQHINWGIVGLESVSIEE